MNKYIDSDISDGLKQMIIGFSNLIHELTSGNEESYVLYDIDMTLCNIEDFLWHYIGGISESHWKDGVFYICINNVTISIDKADNDNYIIFKREENDTH